MKGMKRTNVENVIVYGFYILGSLASIVFSVRELVRRDK